MWKMRFIDPSARIYHPVFGTIDLFLNEDGIYQVGFQAGQNISRKDRPELLIAVDTLARKFAESCLEYLTGKKTTLDIPVDWSIFQPFQRSVLEQACKIPFGTICTYGEIARFLGNAGYSRAVGTALGRNPVPIIIPCHRVVATDGRLRGYSAPGGITTKAWLLELEGHQILPGPSVMLMKG